MERNAVSGILAVRRSSDWSSLADTCQQVSKEEWNTVKEKSHISTATHVQPREVPGLVEGVRPDPRISAVAPRAEYRDLINEFKQHKKEVIQEASQLILRDGVLSLLILAEMSD